MKPQDLRVGQVLDMKITHGVTTTYIVGTIVGIRADYFNPDITAVLIAGIDNWIVLKDEIEWETVIG